MLICIHGHFLYSVKLCIIHMRKINLLDETFISRDNILQMYFCKQKRLRLIRDNGLGEHLPRRPAFVPSQRRASRENLFHYLARVSPASMHDVINEREEQRRSAARMRRMKSQEGETHSAGKRHQRVTKTGESAKGWRRKRGSFTSGRWMRRSWFVSA